jgi:flavodoxin
MGAHPSLWVHLPAGGQARLKGARDNSKVMKSCIVYFSRTGNTKLMAEALSEVTQAPVFDIRSADPAVVKDCDMLILGTPVEGFRPARETVTFAKALPTTDGRKAILFCTYALWKGSTFRSLSALLGKKGYECILKVSKKRVVPGQTDFSDVAGEVKRVLEKSVHGH